MAVRVAQQVMAQQMGLCLQESQADGPREGCARLHATGNSADVRPERFATTIGRQRHSVELLKHDLLSQQEPNVAAMTRSDPAMT